MAKKPETEEEKKVRETVEAIAKNIEDLANGVRKVLDGRLNKRGDHPARRIRCRQDATGGRGEGARRRSLAR